MSNLDLLVAKAQIWLASVFSIGFLGCLFVLIFFHQQMTQLGITLVTGLTGVLGTVVTQIVAYFFARHRPASDDSDPTQPPPETKP